MTYADPEAQREINRLRGELLMAQITADAAVQSEAKTKAWAQATMRSLFESETEVRELKRIIEKARKRITKLQKVLS